MVLREIGAFTDRVSTKHDFLLFIHWPKSYGCGPHHTGRILSFVGGAVRNWGALSASPGIDDSADWGRPAPENTGLK
jgi:hypothetical protein